MLFILFLVFTLLQISPIFPTFVYLLPCLGPHHVLLALTTLSVSMAYACMFFG